MKEASGEVSMTLIVIVAAALILTTFVTYFWPKLIKPMIESKWKSMAETEIVIPLDSIIK